MRKAGCIFPWQKEVLISTTLKLSEAILLGSTKRPQCFKGWVTGSLFNHTVTETCALAAAVDAIGGLDRKFTPEDYIDFTNIWPLLRNKSKCPTCITQDAIGTIIQHLNDDHRWTRPRIALWVAELEQTPETQVDLIYESNLVQEAK